MPSDVRDVQPPVKKERVRKKTVIDMATGFILEEGGYSDEEGGDG